jgi:hypothetical protein
VAFNRLSDSRAVDWELVDLRSADTNQILAWLGEMDALREAIGTAA